MPWIRFFENKFSAFEVPSGTTLMNALLDQDVPVASSCHGDGICSKCRLRIVQGAQSLSAPNPVELELRQRNGIAADFRVSCQTQVLGDIEIDATYW